MSQDVLFASNEMQMRVGLKMKAKKGSLEVNSVKELVLYGDNGETLDKAPVVGIDFKFSSIDPGATTIKMNGVKWYISFEPPMKSTGFGAIGGAIAGMEHAQREDVKAARVRRDELRALVEKIQAEK